MGVVWPRGLGLERYEAAGEFLRRVGAKLVLDAKRINTRDLANAAR
jgi:hypothetical protein